MTTTSTNNGRLDYLDAVRAFALTLGIVFHASLSFLPMFIGWAVMDVSTDDIVSIFALISHSYRMELFFLIAGFFSHMTFHSKGSGNFIKSRGMRIAIPFIIAWFILRPLMVSGWVMGAESLQGSVDIFKGLSTGFASLNTLPQGLFTGTHLWFLYYLLLITACVLALRFILTLRIFERFELQQKADVVVRWLSNSRLAIVTLSILTACCLWFMNQWGMDTPDKTLVPQLPVLLVYGGFFILGWLLHRQGPLIELFARLTWSRFILCIVAIISATLLSDYAMKTGHPQYAFLKAAYCFSFALMMWCLVVLTIGLFKRWFNRPSKTVRYFADASYWLYLIHLPIVVWLQIAFAELALHWSLKLFAISAITILLSLLVYDLCVRNTFIGATLNGRRLPRLLFTRQAKSQLIES